MSFRLKKNEQDFEVVDGAYAGRKYGRGRVYEVVPPEESWRFETIEFEAPQADDPEPESAAVINMPSKRRVRVIDDQPA